MMSKNNDVLNRKKNGNYESYKKKQFAREYKIAKGKRFSFEPDFKSKKDCLRLLLR